MNEDAIEIIFVCPHDISNPEWVEIAKLALEYGKRGETNFTKCAILAYVEWLSLDNIDRRKH